MLVCFLCFSCVYENSPYTLIYNTTEEILLLNYLRWPFFNCSYTVNIPNLVYGNGCICAYVFFTIVIDQYCYFSPIFCRSFLGSKMSKTDLNINCENALVIYFMNASINFVNTRSIKCSKSNSWEQTWAAGGMDKVVSSAVYFKLKFFELQ